MTASTSSAAQRPGPGVGGRIRRFGERSTGASGGCHGCPGRDTWVETGIEGFAHPDVVPGGESHEAFPREALAQTMRDMTQATGFGHYLASLDGGIVGGAGLRTSEGVAQLCGSATLPMARRRGVQTALLARRLLDASRMGCDVAVVTTQPGSKSQQNAQRHGFTLLYTRAILVREPR